MKFSFSVDRSLFVRVAVIATVLTVLIVGWKAWSFSQQNLTGIGPALLPSKQNVAELIDAREIPLTLPKGFSLEIFAKDLGAPRVMVEDPDGSGLIVSIPARGQVLELFDADQDGKAEQTTILLSGLNAPHGLAFWCINASCKLFVAETSAVRSYDWDPVAHRPINMKKILDLPSGGIHATRSLTVLPSTDGARLLIAIGSSCNACLEKNPQRGAVLVANMDGSDLHTFASGLRNSVFQTVRDVGLAGLPRYQVWGTEMGRDLLGDNTPPDEINLIEEGKHYGWPWCYGQNTHDSVFDARSTNPCVTPAKMPSRLDLQAHSAPLGLVFVEGDGWPSEYHGDLLVAFHGSWNRSQPTGYKIVRVKLGPNGESQGIEDFMTGWLQKDGTTLGRPVGLWLKSDGQLFISDDKAGVIYRVYATK